MVNSIIDVIHVTTQDCWNYYNILFRFSNISLHSFSIKHFSFAFLAISFGSICGSYEGSGTLCGLEKEQVLCIGTSG